MVVCLWFVRRIGENFDPHIVYGDNPDTFSLKFYHGGKFTASPGRKYVRGQVSYVDMVDRDVFSMHEVHDMVQYFGYAAQDMIYAHFRVPELDLDLGLRALGNDHDILELLTYVSKHKIIEIYIKHGFTTLDTFEKSPFEKPRVMIDEINEIGTSNPSKALALQWHDVNELDSEIGNVMVNNDMAEGNEIENDSASDEDGDDSKNNDQEDNDHEDSDDSDDGDFIIDEAEKIVDYDVDMHEFNDAVDADVEENNGSDGEKIVDPNFDLDNFDSLSEEDDPLLKKAIRKLRRDKRHSKDPIAEPFYVGQQFSNKSEIIGLVKQYVVHSRRQLKIKKNDLKRLRVVCDGIMPTFDGSVKESFSGSQQVDGLNKQLKNSRKKNLIPTCPFKLHITNHNKLSSWVVKTFINTHNCLQTRDVKLCTMSFIAKEIEELISVNPGIPIAALRDLISKKYHINISTMKVFRAKAMACQKIEGEYKKQYELLRDYCDELRRSNPGTTVKLDVETEPNPSETSRKFRRIYICFGALKAGFKMCGRRVLGLDGSFMKGPYPGQILSAVGIDSNNGIYPLAYAVVEAETLSSWTWFLETLRDDLDLYSNSNFTFISDRQKVN